MCKYCEQCYKLITPDTGVYIAMNKRFCSNECRAEWIKEYYRRKKDE